MPILPSVFLNALLMAGVFLSTGCVDREPLTPTDDGSVWSMATSDSVATAGCAVFTVNVSDRRQVSVEAQLDPECGSVHPVLGGEAAFDAAGLVLRIPIAIENGGSTPLGEPAYVRSSDNLLEVIGGAGGDQGGLLLFLNADSTDTGLADDEGVVRYIWRYDGLLPEEDSAAFMKPGERSDVRWIEIAVDPSVETLRVGLHAHATIPAGWEGRSYVPELPPDSISQEVAEEIFAEENRVYPSDTGYFYLRNVIRLYFEEGTPWERRQEAVDAIGGEVIGGHRMVADGGLYLIRIKDDGTPRPLEEAIETLNSFPYIASVGRFGHFPIGPRYRRPVDSGEWSSWQLRPDLAEGQTAALELIAAPMAWGCETGRIGFPVAVTDDGFSLPEDLSPNIQAVFGTLGDPGSANYHGTAVASVLGAAGNNGIGMTGVMWNASMRLYDFTRTFTIKVPGPSAGDTVEVKVSAGVDAIIDAAGHGARVINVSWGPNSQPDDEDAVRDYRAVVRELRSQLSAQATGEDAMPLIVIAAGNNGADARYALNTLLVEELPEHVIVVGASSHQGGGNVVRWGGSNHGSLVDVYAPGGDTYVLGDDGSVYARAGTSFAAPMVSGVAGLLLSFDPRLSTGEIKDLILEGAARDGRTVDGAPFLNAYEALKAAGERSGAPMCGNRVWAETGQIYAQRATGAEALGPPEPEYAPFGVAPIHGGKFIRYETSEGVKALRWSIEENTTLWEPSGLPAGYVRGGTDASVYGFSHDQDTLAIFNSSAVNNTNWWHSSDREEAVVQGHEVVYDDFGNPSLVNPWDIGNLTIEYVPQPVRSLCIERFESGGCTISLSEDRFWIFRLGYPQHGPEAYLAVSPLETVPTDSTEWRTCSHDEGRECRDVRIDQRHNGTRVYRMAVPGGVVEEVDNLPDGGAVFWIGQGEGDPALVLGRGEWKIHSWYDPEHFRATGDPVRERNGDIETCGIEYRNPAGFGLDKRIETRNVCNWQDLDYPSEAGGGTISPNLVGGTGTPAVDDSASGIISLTARVVGFNGSGLEEIR
jgi:hypothetical protein